MHSLPCAVQAQHLLKNLTTSESNKKQYFLCLFRNHLICILFKTNPKSIIHQNISLSPAAFYSGLITSKRLNNPGRLWHGHAVLVYQSGGKRKSSLNTSGIKVCEALWVWHLCWKRLKPFAPAAQVSDKPSPPCTTLHHLWRQLAGCWKPLLPGIQRPFTWLMKSANLAET